MIYQQESGKITIVVKKENNIENVQGANQTQTDNVSSSGSSNGGNEYSEDGEYSGMDRQSRIIRTNVTHALAMARQMSLLTLDFVVGGIGYSNGDQALQDRVQRQLEVASDSTGVLASVGMGALFGSWGGGVGTIVGATLGLVQSGASLLVKYATRGRKYDYDIFKEENEIEYNKNRANINLTNGRLR